MTPANRNGLDQPAFLAIPDDSVGFLLAERVAYHLLERKIEDVVILDLRKLSDVCDFFVLGSGSADVQVKAAARMVRESLLTIGQRPAGIEGESDGRWVLLDYIDVVVHVLKPVVRQYYQLERLWGDAQALAVDIDYLCGQGFRRHHPDLTPLSVVPKQGFTG